MIIDGILFDLDGTLWNSSRAVAESWGETLRALDPEARCPGPAEIRSIMGMTAPQIAEALFSHYGADAERICLACIHGENAYIAVHGGELFPDLEQTLATLAKRAPLFIVSNCLEGYIESFLQSSGLDRYFRDFECEGSTGLTKAENIALLCRRHGLRRPVYIGDTRSDELAARGAGVAFVHAAYGFGVCEAPDAVIGSLPELCALLQTEEGSHV